MFSWVVEHEVLHSVLYNLDFSFRNDIKEDYIIHKIQDFPIDNFKERLIIQVEALKKELKLEKK